LDQAKRFSTMKLILPILLAAVIACAGDAPSDQSAFPQASKRRHEHRDASGKVDAYTETFYRGKERILIQATYTTSQPSGIKMWREFVVDGKTVLKEMDYGEAKPQMVWVYRDGSAYEGFRRHPDGVVEPMTSEELGKVMREVQEFTAAFEGVMERVRDADQDKQTQRPGGNEK
jgi:hypothetical protein